jgi:hypothetical protein
VAIADLGKALDQEMAHVLSTTIDTARANSRLARERNGYFDVAIAAVEH